MPKDLVYFSDSISVATVAGVVMNLIIPERKNDNV